MGMMDKAKDMMGDNMDRDSMMSRVRELMDKDQRGEANEDERSELSRLRSKLGM